MPTPRPRALLQEKALVRAVARSRGGFPGAVRQHGPSFLAGGSLSDQHNAPEFPDTTCRLAWTAGKHRHEAEIQKAHRQSQTPVPWCFTCSAAPCEPHRSSKGLVEKLWTIREFPVEEPTRKNNLRPLRPERDDLVLVDAPSSVASLDRAAATRTLSVHLNTWGRPFIVTKNPLGDTRISSKSSASRRIAGARTSSAVRACRPRSCRSTDAHPMRPHTT